MVQMFQLPETTQGRLGREMGAAFGEGLSKNLPDPQLRMAGRMQQSALQKFKESLGPGDDPRAISMKWGQAMAGVPGADKLAQTVLPPHLQYAVLNMDFSQNGGGGGGQQPPIEPGDGGQPNAVAPLEMTGDGGGMGGILQPPGAGVTQPPGAGVTQPTGGPQATGGGMNPYALRLSMLTKQPYEKALQQISGLPQAQINAMLQQASEAKTKSEIGETQELYDFVKSRLPSKTTTPNNINDFLRIGQKYQNQGLSQEDWYRKTQKDYNEFTRAYKAYERANLPGFISGMARGGKHRAKALKRLEPLIRPIVEAGFSDRIREDLIAEGATPFEAEMLIKPMDKSGMQEAQSLPKLPYKEERLDPMSSMFLDEDYPTYDDMVKSKPGLINQITDKYSDFLVKNVNPNVSLLGLREELRRENGLGWQHYYDAVVKAMDKGLELDSDQQSEIAELTQAPRDSLPWIFQEPSRIWDYLKGAK